ncbi:MAG: hypothetical protein AAF687_13335 [Pseudomonadota bacterium]
MIEALHPLATFVLGLLAGALLTEGAILVPYWRRMEPEEFLRLHSTMGPSLYRYFAPLTIAGVMLPAASAGVSLGLGEEAPSRVAAGILCLCALGIYFAYFKAANAKFAEHTITASELPAELGRWATWHTTRTIIVLIAFGCSLAALLL